MSEVAAIAEEQPALFLRVLLGVENLAIDMGVLVAEEIIWEWLV